MRSRKRLRASGSGSAPRAPANSRAKASSRSTRGRGRGQGGLGHASSASGSGIAGPAAGTPGGRRHRAARAGRGCCPATCSSFPRLRRRPSRNAPSAGRTRWPAATAWARSFSWWGKARSRPPPCRSKPSPSRSRAMTTHSVCQPGRPGPHGESQLGSPGLAAFQRAKSIGERLPASSSTSTRAPTRRLSMGWRASRP